jgi:hypothetical protein
MILTPKALVNLSSGLERSDNPGLKLANAPSALEALIVR